MTLLRNRLTSANPPFPPPNPFSPLLYFLFLIYNTSLDYPTLQRGLLKNKMKLKTPYLPSPSPFFSSNIPLPPHLNTLKVIANCIINDQYLAEHLEFL